VIDVCVLGPSGKMGRAVLDAAKPRQDLRIASTVDIGEDMAAGLAKAQVYIDFTSPGGTRAAAKAALARKTAAVIGTAMPGGCSLTLPGDYRIMAAGNARIGIPELLVGVPFPPAVIEVIRFSVPPQHLQSLIYTGKTVPPDEALRLGLIDEIAPPEALLNRAAEVATQLAALPANIFKLTKRQLRDKAIDRAKHYANELDATVREEWGAPETHTRIWEYLARTVGAKTR
jgi:enoyl-CoA hydratase/carnithine racemase